MKKRIISLLLVLIMNLGIFGMTAEAANAGQQTRNGGSYDQVISEMLADEKGAIIDATGLLYDLDANGVQELIAVHTATIENFPRTVCDVYTLSGNIVTPLLQNEELYANAGGPSGAVYVLEDNGEVYFAYTKESGETGGYPSMRRNGSWALFSLSDNTLTLAKSIKYEVLWVWDDNIGQSVIAYDESYAIINGTKYGYDVLEGWEASLNILRTIPASYGASGGDGVPLEELKGLTAGVEQSGSFADVAANAWYAEAVGYAVTNGLMNGTGNSKFEPESSMTRAMLVMVLWRYAGEPLEGANDFADVKDGQWYTEAVAWAAHNGIVGGVGGGRFDPDGNITREQLAAILYRYCNSVGIDTSARADLTSFPDGGKVSDYAQDPLAWAVAVGLVTGTKEGSNTYLDPQGSATRAQVATILMRFIENIAE